MQIGYARGSTQDQDLPLHYKTFHESRCDKIYKAKAPREDLKLALNVLQKTTPWSYGSSTTLAVA